MRLTFSALWLLGTACTATTGPVPAQDQKTPPNTDATQKAPAVAVELASLGRGAMLVRVPPSGSAPGLWVDRTEASTFDLLLYGAEAEGQWLTTLPEAPRRAAMVTLTEAKAYCHWSGKRLPTFAEWTRAAGSGLHGSAGADPQPVDAGHVNLFGLYGVDNESIEWTSSEGSSSDKVRVGGLVAMAGTLATKNEIVFDEETKAAVRCVAAEAAAKPLPAKSEPVTLVEGVCAQRAADRATFCLSAPNGYFAPMAPNPAAGWTRNANLDGAIQIASGCALFAEHFACNFEDRLQLRKAEGASRFTHYAGGFFVPDGAGGLRPIAELFPSSRKPIQGGRFFDLESRVIEFAANGSASLLERLAGEESRKPLKLPSGVSDIFELGQLTCLRTSSGLSCGELDERGYVEAARLPLAVKSAAYTLGAFCLLTDDGAVQCGRADAGGRETIETTLASLRSLPIATVSGASQLASGYGNICAATPRGDLYCFSKALQEELLPGKTLKLPVVLEPAPLPRD